MLKKIFPKFLMDLEDTESLFDVIENGILITDEQSKTIYVNPAVTRITGYEKHEVENKDPSMLRSGYHKKDFYKKMWQEITDKGFWEGEIWNRRKSGQVYPEFLTVTKIKHHASNNFFYVGIFSDITVIKSEFDRTLHLAFYDPLTELANRNLFLDRIKKVAKHVHTSHHIKSVAVFYMDLDGFKQVNDIYGHFVGDKLLGYVGQRLHSITRAQDTVARIGGDEFAVIFSLDSPSVSAVDFAKRIVEVIEEPFQVDDLSLKISISIGICFYPDQAQDVDSLLANADKAMYRAKKLGSKIECC